MSGRSLLGADSQAVFHRHHAVHGSGQRLGAVAGRRVGRVALNGTAPDATTRDRAKTLAAAVDGVVAVDNRLTVGAKK